MPRSKFSWFLRTPPPNIPVERIMPSAYMVDPRFVIHDPSVQALPNLRATPRESPSARVGVALPIPERLRVSTFTLAIARARIGRRGC